MRYWAITIVLLTITLSGCLSWYRPDIEQGNILTAEMISKLEPGMTKRQVRYILGTPLISDLFHQQRWDYFYSFQKGTGKSANQRRLTILFQDDRVIRIIDETAGPSSTAPAVGKTHQDAQTKRIWSL